MKYTNPTIVYEERHGYWILVCVGVNEDNSFEDVELRFMSFSSLYDAQKKMLDNPYPVDINTMVEVNNEIERTY